MVSNKLSSRRTFLVRPKVCKSAPKLAKITAASFPSCSLTPHSPTVKLGDFLAVELFACLQCEPYGLAIDVKPGSSSGSLGVTGIPGNCQGVTLEFTPSEAGPVRLWCEVTWFNGATCTPFCSITVLP